MTDRMSRGIRLASRPNGLPSAANFRLARVELEPLKNKETAVEGIGQAVGAFLGLFEGKNVGKRFADLPTKGCPDGSVIEFTLLWKEAQRWEGRNYSVAVTGPKQVPVIPTSVKRKVPVKRGGASSD